MQTMFEKDQWVYHTTDNMFYCICKVINNTILEVRKPAHKYSHTDVLASECIPVNLTDFDLSKVYEITSKNMVYNQAVGYASTDDDTLAMLECDEDDRMYVRVITGRYDTIFGDGRINKIYKDGRCSIKDKHPSYFYNRSHFYAYTREIIMQEKEPE